MASNHTLNQFYSKSIFLSLWVYFSSGLLVLIIQTVFITPAPVLAQNSEIIVRLSGDINYPGDLSVISNTIKLKKICFLGVDAKGKVDKDFLRLISSQGTPEGNYKVVPPLSVEKWPVNRFVKNGALRLQIIDGPGLRILNSFDKLGIVIHGRDFYPILDGILKNKTMINFYNDQLFEELKNQGLDALLMFRQESMYWLTGYDTFGYVYFQSLILTTKGDLVLLTRAPDLRQAQNTSIIKNIRIWINTSF